MPINKPKTARRAYEAYRLLLVRVVKHRGTEDEPTPLEISRAAVLVESMAAERGIPLAELIPDDAKREGLETWARSYEELLRLSE